MSHEKRPHLTNNRNIHPLFRFFWTCAHLRCVRGVCVCVRVEPVESGGTVRASDNEHKAPLSFFQRMWGWGGVWIINWEKEEEEERKHAELLLVKGEEGVGVVDGCGVLTVERTNERTNGSIHLSLAVATARRFSS
jgi:hypothetical protein